MIDCVLLLSVDYHLISLHTFVRIPFNYFRLFSFSDSAQPYQLCFVIRYGLSLDTTLLPCENPIQLTTSGCYHSVTVDAVRLHNVANLMDSSFIIVITMTTQDNHYFVTVFSNECSAPSVAVYSITLEPLSSTFLNSIWTGTGLFRFLCLTMFLVHRNTCDDFNHLFHKWGHDPTRVIQLSYVPREARIQMTVKLLLF